MLNELGLTVARSIPIEHLAGLLSGALSLHGGVIRDAGGRIVSHLVMPAASSAFNLVPGVGALGSIINGIQLHGLSADLAAVKAATDQVLNYSMASAALSGLGFVTSVTGFAYIAIRLRGIERRLSALEKQTQAIRKFLESSRHAELSNAVDSLRLAQAAPHPETRHHLLIQSRQSFGTLAHQYRAQLEDIGEVAELSAVEDCYVLAVIGSVTALSDLGMYEQARDEMRQQHQLWQQVARKHCTRLLLKGDPERLLDPRYVEALPTANLIRFLDFSNNANRGIGWIDELRQRLGKTTMVWGALSTTEAPVISYANKLLAKNDALDGFAAHMDFLAEKKVSLSHFAHEANELIERAGAPYLLLTPARAS